MAHNLTITPLGLAEMFYVGESPWHGLGTKLDQVARSGQALLAAGLNWTVGTEGLCLTSGAPVTGFRATVRLDTGKPLGVVGMRYALIQNEEAFRFLDALVGEAKAMFHTAGSLREGRKVWALVKLPSDLVVVSEDHARKYLLLANSHDGTSAMTCQFVATRVVCENTLNAALREGGGSERVSVRHTPGATGRVREARRVLGISLKYFDLLGERFRAMSVKQLNQRMLTEYLEAVWPIGTEDDERRAHDRRVQEVLAYLFREGRGNQLPGVRGSLWAGYNAVTEYADHVRGVRECGPRKTWAESALFEGGARLKRRAFRVALDVLAERPLGRLWRRVKGQGLIAPEASS